MKILRYIVLLICILNLTQNICLAQYHAALSNSQLVNSNTFEFDFIIKSTGADFTLASYQCALTYNTAIADGGTLAFSYIGGSSELSNPPFSSLISLVDGISELCFFSNMGADAISSTYRKVGRFRITNSKAFAQVNPDISWNFNGSINTILVNPSEDITNQAYFSNLENSTPLPVELVDFTAASIDNKIILNWRTATELNTHGFEVERKFNSSNKNGNIWETLGFIKGSSNSSAVRNYNYEDKKLYLAGEYVYRLKMIDLDGTFEYSDEVKTVVAAPEKTILEQNFPNPFNPQTSIRFTLSNDCNVKLYIYSISGELVEKILDEYKPAGFYSFNWNANSLASGMYISLLETISSDGKIDRSMKKMLYVK